MELVSYDEFEQLAKECGFSSSIYLNFETMTEGQIGIILDSLHLPLKAGMNRDSLVSLFGPNDAVDIYVPTHRTYEFTCGEKWVYSVFCTVEVEQGKGLVSVSIKP